MISSTCYGWWEEGVTETAEIFEGAIKKMPSTVGIKQKENISKEESLMASQDDEQHAVNIGPVKSKMAVPILLQNGIHCRDVDNDVSTICDGPSDEGKQTIAEFRARLKFLRVNDQVKELQTTLRDRYEWGFYILSAKWHCPCFKTS